jgi:hypothetical protein
MIETGGGGISASLRHSCIIEWGDGGGHVWYTASPCKSSPPDKDKKMRAEFLVQKVYGSHSHTIAIKVAWRGKSEKRIKWRANVDLAKSPKARQTPHHPRKKTATAFELGPRIYQTVHGDEKVSPSKNQC